MEAPAGACLALRLPSTLFILCAALMLSPGSLQSQWPGEVAGQVLDIESGQGIASASVEIAGVVRLTTDGSGAFRSRGLDPGRYRVVARHLGYADVVAEVEVRNGEVSRVLLELHAAALPLDTLHAVASGGGEAGVSRIGRRRIEQLGARSAGDVLRALPGVRVVERVPGGPQILSLRGSGADQVLVLLDGVPLNDPITGEADLSTLSAASVEEITLLRGARSARYGPGAQGGAILIRSRRSEGEREGALAVGSFGDYAARFDFGGLSGSGSPVGLGGPVDSGGPVSSGVAWGVGIEGRTLEGDFRFTNPAHADGDGAGPDAGRSPPSRRRENADMRQLLIRGGAEGLIGGGTWNARLGFEALDRGNPGRSFAPSRSARQRLRKGRVSLSWRRESFGEDGARSEGDWSARERRSSEEVSLYSTLQGSTAEDQNPPFGAPYNDHTVLASSGLRIELTREPAAPRWVAVGGGLELERQSVRSDVLRGGGPGIGGGAEGSIDRHDLGLFLRSRLRLHATDSSPGLSLVARAHRDGLGGRWYPGHEATLAVPIRGISLHLAHRSSFSPPTLGDQFFREGVGIVANPELRAERVPSEWEMGGTGTLSHQGATLSLGAELYRGDVRDMIIWAPDFRFVWSPRNVDVARWGFEGWGEFRGAAGARLSGSYSFARMTYGAAGGTRGVQLAYRPRHSASLSAGWEGGEWRGELTGRYTGLRYPVPAAVNAMAPYWSFGATVSRAWTWSGWTIHPVARIERLLDRRDSHIFGFPEPGRTLFLEMRLSRAP